MKVLIIRFSSIGDLTQSLSIPSLIREEFPDSEIHFVTRQDLAQLVENHIDVKKVWALDRKTGLSGLWKLIKLLRKENFTHIYDAHNNLRSTLIRWFVPAAKKLVRPMMRIKRFFLLQFGLNFFEKPFSGQRDLLKPLEKWGLQFRYPRPPQLYLSTAAIQKAQQLLIENEISENSYTVLAPSAAYALKRWPLTYWKSLVEKNKAEKFIVLGGPEDLFLTELAVPNQVFVWAGQTTLLESAALIQKAKAVVANDTGLLHFAEQLGRPTIALMGPAPFGFPSRDATTILERNLDCRPCSKHGQGPCRNKIFHECLVSISPEEVNFKLHEKWSIS